jgi:hypothetical protein
LIVVIADVGPRGAVNDALAGGDGRLLARIVVDDLGEDHLELEKNAFSRRVKDKEWTDKKLGNVHIMCGRENQSNDNQTTELRKLIN